MKSWWDLGEGVGYQGAVLATYDIPCAFCLERGKWSLAFHAEKKKPNSDKRLNFDTLKCGNCAGYIQVLWSANEYGGPHSSLHAYRALPLPLGRYDPPAHWPQEVQRTWQQANRSLQHESYDAAVVMARSALQAALRDQGAKGKNLATEITDLATRGILPPLMEEWSHELRALGNDAAHPDAQSTGATAADARDLVEFLDYLLEYLYNLPKAIADYRARRKPTS